MAFGKKLTPNSKRLADCECKYDADVKVQALSASGVADRQCAMVASGSKKTRQVRRGSRNWSMRGQSLLPGAGPTTR